MLLTIDAGNTNIVFAIFDKESRTQQNQWRISTSVDRTADEYFVWLNQLMRHDGLDPSAIDGSIISTVVPLALFNLRSLCRNYFNSDPLVVGDSKTDVNAARAAGVPVLGVSYGYNMGRPISELKPDAAVDSLCELPTLISED